MEWITQIIIGAGFCAVLGVWVYQKNKEIQHLKKQLKKRSTQLQQIQAQLSAQVDESAEKLSLAQNNLEAAERAKSEFLARISYELKSPLVVQKTAKRLVVQGIQVR
jgi:signal transduction histidine kinase